MLWHAIQGAGGVGGDRSWDLAYASYSGTSLSVSSQDTTPTDLFFKPDGTKMYVTGSRGDDVNEYSLSTAWDISTASYQQNFSVRSQEANPTGLFFKSDGTKMYVCGTSGSSGDAVYEYDLSTAWDISTASYSQSFTFTSQDTTPNQIFFRDNGTKMYMVGITNDAVYEYDLSTAWDVSTASYQQNFSVSTQQGQPQGLFFKDDGTKMYICGAAGGIPYGHQYALSTAWDVSTASYEEVFDMRVGFTGNAQGLFFKADGTKMYVVESSNDQVVDFDIG